MTPPSRSPSLSVLIADDETSIADLVRHWLTRDGHRVTCAHSGEEAGRMLRSGHFDLVITDIVMPDGDGFELIAAVKTHQPAARVLAISGGGKYLESADCLKMARGLGAHGVLIKPFNWAEMRTAIEAVCPARVSVGA